MENNNDTTQVVKTEEEWKSFLTPEQYHVIREKGTEAPFTGKLLLNKDKGVYTCAACGNELFTSDMKFDSHCGWPSFDKEIAGGKIKTHVDTSYGMIRTEIMCAKCGGHLGHLFDDGPTETGARYCVNSLSIDFKKQ
ncbi:MAG: peptide-methionine (R)-S-oxide reductase MsrB [Chitinophagales bacterium]|nr:peptide-methionine (R)-S-oxide reductase MsrB [Chitinophagales bacterium]